ncbi:hypothetical protein NLI96_g4909 [Meripilus lineatus]|uniref:DUF6535 domain-containing protein n=1 Tax=Meripilus lineatus TaxID=2056292 RepID=A0AAD5V8V2_9APHY|nr:hypothetical protein NLI96_g4909 [Physisporinus lineatus]
MAPTSPEDPVAGPSSTQNVPEGGLPTNQKEDATQATSKENRLDQLKRELVEKCAKIDEEYPEVAHKDGWSALHEMLKIRDEKDIKKHFENIDTLLVFAGLYSAILTAFLVEAYKLLQPDSSDDSKQILLEISRQLASFTITSGLVNATYVPSSLPTGSFTPTRSSVWLNGLWFVALILSLTTASLGLLVKQWLRECDDNPAITPEEHRRIRLFRVRGLRKYKVHEMATFLPLLLQISLILFFSGLVLFTQTVHATIGWVIMGLVVIWGTFLVITTILPWFSASCPYKTPFLKPNTLQFKRLLNYLNVRLTSFARIIHFDWLYDTLHSKLFDLVDSETGISKDSSLDVDVLLDAYETSGNANVWETIMQCVDLQRPSESFANLCSVILRASGKPCSESSTSADLASRTWECLPYGIDALFVKSLATYIRSRLIQAFEQKEESRLDDDIGRLLLLLNKWSHQLKSRSSSRSSRMGRSLVRMSSALMEGLFSAPFTRGFLVKYASELFGSGVRNLKEWEYFDKSSEYRATTLRSLRFSRHCLAMSAFVEASKQVFDPSSTLEEHELIKPIRGIILCAGRSTEECWPVLKNEFRHLSGLIACKVDTLQNPSGWQDPDDTSQWHCVLDMAMRLHKRTPGIIDKTLFEALNTFSVKMFDLYVEHRMDGNLSRTLAEYIRKDAERESPTLDEVLDRYVEVEVRGRGEYKEYEGKWDYQRLRVDCKHRIEFILNYEKCGNNGYGDLIRYMMTRFDF